jgi:hypothetical protein
MSHVEFSGRRCSRLTSISPFFPEATGTSPSQFVLLRNSCRVQSVTYKTATVTSWEVTLLRHHSSLQC